MAEVKQTKTSRKGIWMKFLSFFDDKTKDLTWRNRNYLFSGTLVVSLITILLFAILGICWPSAIFEPNGAVIGMRNFWVSLLAPFSFTSWGHLLGCTFIFVICGSYLERKWGTFCYLGILSIVWILGCLCTQTTCDLGISAGSSMMYYGLYAFNLVDLLFSFHKSRRSIGNIIYGVIVLIFAVVMISIYTLDGGASTIRFSFLTGFSHDPAHLSSFIASLIFAFVLYFIVLSRQKKL